MLDAKALTGTFTTMVAASSSWLGIVEPVVTIFFTVAVGSVTLWYTVERALKLRRERKENDDAR